MTREEAKKELSKMIFELGFEDNVDDKVCALNMAIQALSQEPCDVSVSEKEPNEITEEVTLRFFKNSLKVRWHDFVIYNVEWLKKNWQMEMDIVCGVEPCTDAVSREDVLNGLRGCICDEWVKTLFATMVKQLPSVTQKSGKWIEHPEIETSTPEYLMFCECSECGNKQCFCKSDIHKKRFCSNCGAKMESEDKA